MFHKGAGYADGHHRICKVCTLKKRQHTGYTKQSSNKTKHYNLLRCYGITLEQYEAMKKAQGGKCKICNSMPTNLHVDHCHVTGKVRGLLCPQCNVGLGSFRDSPEFLEAAKQYIIGF